MANLFSKLTQYVNASLDTRIEGLKKAQPTAEDLAKAERSDGLVGRKGLIFDPFTHEFQTTGLFKQRFSYLQPAVLKQVSRRDGVVAAAIDTRASQVSSACKKQGNRFDWGFKLIPKDKTMEADAEEVRKLEEFILNCGHKEDRPPEDKLTFDQWGYMVTRDLMVYGHAAIEKVLRRDGDLFTFLPLPAETIYYANKKVDQKTIENMKNLWANTIDSDKVSIDRAARGEYEFVQVLQGKVVEGFTKDELIFARFNLETDVDLNGYCYGPLERAMSAIISHMQIENHQRQFFVHGVASKGLLVLQGDVTPNTLKALQAQWNNQITGPLNAWRTPILAGIKGVQWVPLTASNRDMEYAAWQDYVLRVICTTMAIAPEEIGFDYLSKGTEQRTMSESNNEWKLTASRDRGLRPVLGRIEAIMNEEIIPAYSKSIAAKYHFVFVGLDAETEMEETQRLQVETTLHTTVNEARKQVDKEELPQGGGFILNPVWIQTVQLNMTKGDFMEKFMGVVGASQRPDLQYVPDPLWFQWQTMQMQMMQGAVPGSDPSGGGGGGGAPDSASIPGADSGPKTQEQSGPPAGPPGAQDKEPPTPEEEQAEMEEEEERRGQEQQAIEQYMAMNPELFKHHKANWDKANELRKSETVGRISVSKIEKTRDTLVKDFRHTTEAMMKEIMAVVADDLKGKK